MKLPFAVILLLLLPAFCAGQAMIGYTFHEIKREHPDISFTIQPLTDAGVSMTGMFYCSEFVYLKPNNRETVVGCLMYPLGDGCLSDFIQYYNEQYVIMSASKWRSYRQGGVMEIELLHDNLNGYYFTFLKIN